MNISALLVFVCAVVSVYGYYGLPCSDCNHPCSEKLLQNVSDRLSKLMAFSDCRLNHHISKKANPTWKCESLTTNMKRLQTVYNATCDKRCDPNSFKEVPILQDIKVFFRQDCPSSYNHSLFVLTVKPVTISLGCTCEKKPLPFPFRQVN